MFYYLISATDYDIDISEYDSRDAARNAMYDEVIERFGYERDLDDDEYKDVSKRDLANTFLSNADTNYNFTDDLVSWYDEGEYCWIVNKVVAENEIRIAH